MLVPPDVPEAAAEALLEDQRRHGAGAAGAGGAGQGFEARRKGLTATLLPQATCSVAGAPRPLRATPSARWRVFPHR